RIFEHDERIAAAQLEYRLLQVTTRLLRHLTARAIATREGYRVHARVGDDPARPFVREQHRSKQSVGETRLPEHLLDLERAARDIGRVLQNPRVPPRERWHREPEYLPEGEIPGHDHEHRTERTEAHVTIAC